MTQLRKTLALLTAVFFVSSLFPLHHLAYAGALVNAPQVSFPQDLSGIKISSDIGSLEEFYQGEKNDLVILVQDAHSVPEAQKNIRNLIDFFEQSYGLHTVAVEGAASKLNPQIFRSFPDRKVLDKVLEQYLNRGELAGAVFASIANKNESQYIGIEDWPLYETGYGYYLKALKNTPSILAELDHLNEAHQSEKEKVYSPSLLKADRAIEQFENNQSELLPILTELAALKTLPENSELALMLSEASRTKEGAAQAELELKKIAAEMKMFMDAADETKVSKNERTLFNEKYQQFQTSRLNYRGFSLYLRDALKRLNISFELPASVLDAAHIHQRIQDIQGSHFLKAFRVYAQSVKESLFQSEHEKQLDRRSRLLYLLRQLAKLELTPSEWTELKILADTGYDETALNILPNKFSTYRAFYQNSELRDQAFLRNLKTLFSEMPLAAGKRKGILFTAGGFHTESLTAALRREGISYLLVTPTLEHIPEMIHYQDQMRGLVSWRDYFEIKNGKLNLYEAFVRSMRDQLVEKWLAQTASGQEKSRGELLMLWREQIIRDLARKQSLLEMNKYTRFLDELEKKNGSLEAPKAIFESVQDFIQGMKQLDAAGRLTKENLMNLLTPSMMPPVTAFALAEEQSVAPALNDIFRFFGMAPKNSNRSDQRTRPSNLRSEIKALNAPQLLIRILQSLLVIHDRRKLEGEAFSLSSLPERDDPYPYLNEFGTRGNDALGAILGKDMMASPVAEHLTADGELETPKRSDEIMNELLPGIYQIFVTDTLKNQSLTVEKAANANNKIFKNANTTLETLNKLNYLSVESRDFISKTQSTIAEKMLEQTLSLIFTLFKDKTQWDLALIELLRLQLGAAESGMGRPEKTKRGNVGRSFLNFMQAIINRDLERANKAINAYIASISSDSPITRDNIKLMTDEVRVIQKQIASMKELIGEEPSINAKIERLRKLHEDIENDRLPELLEFGDKHGNSKDLERILTKAQDAAKSGKRLHIIGHGDGFDRGRNNLRNWEIFHALMNLSKESENIQVDLLFGNHDVWLIEAMLLHNEEAKAAWRKFGGEELLRELGEEKARALALWVLENFKLYTMDEWGFLHVHAGILMDDAGNPNPDGQRLRTFGRRLERIQVALKADSKYMDLSENQKEVGEFFERSNNIYWAREENWLNKLFLDPLVIDTENSEKARTFFKSVIPKPDNDEDPAPISEHDWKDFLLLYPKIFEKAGISFKLNTRIPPVRKETLDRFLLKIEANGIVTGHIHLMELLEIDHRVFVIDVDDGDPGHLIFNREGIFYDAINRPNKQDRIMPREKLLEGILEEIARLNNLLKKIEAYRNPENTFSPPQDEDDTAQTFHEIKIPRLIEMQSRQTTLSKESLRILGQQVQVSWKNGILSFFVRESERSSGSLRISEIKVAGLPLKKMVLTSEKTLEGNHAGFLIKNRESFEVGEKGNRYYLKADKKVFEIMKSVVKDGRSVFVPLSAADVQDEMSEGFILVEIEPVDFEPDFMLSNEKDSIIILKQGNGVSSTVVDVMDRIKDESEAGAILREIIEERNPRRSELRAQTEIPQLTKESPSSVISPPLVRWASVVLLAHLSGFMRVDHELLDEAVHTAVQAGPEIIEHELVLLSQEKGVQLEGLIQSATQRILAIWQAGFSERTRSILNQHRKNFPQTTDEEIMLALLLSDHAGAQLTDAIARNLQDSPVKIGGLIVAGNQMDAEPLKKLFKIFRQVKENFFNRDSRLYQNLVAANLNPETNTAAFASSYTVVSAQNLSEIQDVQIREQVETFLLPQLAALLGRIKKDHPELTRLDAEAALIKALGLARAEQIISGSGNQFNLNFRTFNLTLQLDILQALASAA